MNRSAIKGLTAWKNNPSRKPLILRGARQVGKTHILREFGKSAFGRYHYVNFEKDERLGQIFEGEFAPVRILEELQFFLDTVIDPEDDLLVFDEIQRFPRALTALKYFQEQLPGLAICAAGSWLGVSLADSAFPVGKVAFLDLFPLNFEEFLQGIGQEQLADVLRARDFARPLPEMAHSRLWDYWKRYLIVGGLPGVINVYREHFDNQYRALKAARTAQLDLLDSYMADIAKHSGKVNALHVERLFRNAPAQLARSQDGSAVKFRFKDAAPGLRGYERLAAPLGWLENARLLLRTSIVERAESPLLGFAKDNRFKQYFFDVGLLGAISGMEPGVILKYDYGSYKGYMAENFVAQELRAAGVRDLYCWEGRTSEVEFLLEGAAGVVPLEVKSGWATQSKSLKVYEERYQPELSFVLSAKNVEVRGRRRRWPVYLAGVVLGRMFQDS